MLIATETKVLLKTINYLYKKQMFFYYNILKCTKVPRNTVSQTQPEAKL